MTVIHHMITTIERNISSHISAGEKLDRFNFNYMRNLIDPEFEEGVARFNINMKEISDLPMELLQNIIFNSIKTASQEKIIEKIKSVNEEGIFNIEKDEEQFEYKFLNNDILIYKNNKESLSLIKKTLETLIPSAELEKETLKIELNLGDFVFAIREFTKHATDDLDMLSLSLRSRISENENTLRNLSLRNRPTDRENISYIIERIVDYTSFNFIKDLLKSIDPMIASVGSNKDDDDQHFYMFSSRQYIEIFLKGEQLPISPNLLSMGTKHFLIMLHKCLEAIYKGKLVMIDELDNGLQIRLAQLLIDLFTNETINKNGAQLLFTTHSINYLGTQSIHQKNHIISFRDKNGTVKFEKYDSILSKVGINRESTRININKHYFNEELFKDNPIYPFMITKEEKNALIEGISLGKETA